MLQIWLKYYCCIYMKLFYLNCRLKRIFSVWYLSYWSSSFAIIGGNVQAWTKLKLLLISSTNNCEDQTHWKFTISLSQSRFRHFFSQYFLNITYLYFARHLLFFVALEFTIHRCMNKLASYLPNNPWQWRSATEL